MLQQSLFGGGEPALAPPRHVDRRLLPSRGRDPSWVEVHRGLLAGADALYADLRDGVAWRREERVMYDARVAVPRLLGSLPRDGAVPPVLEALRGRLEGRHGVAFASVQVAHYRDGRDSVAFHRDRGYREHPRAIVAVLSLGAPRRFLLRPVGGGPSLSFEVQGGDLLVMGGACQRDWEHGVPKARGVGPRIAVMFRHRGGALPR
jgi:alkylated DNA repair dioxygenase AlkB